MDRIVHIHLLIMTPDEVVISLQNVYAHVPAWVPTTISLLIQKRLGRAAAWRLRTAEFPGPVHRCAAFGRVQGLGF